MTVLSELRRRARHIAVPALGGCVLAYFAYHTVQGDRGLLSYLRLSNEVARAEAAVTDLTAERRELQHRANLLDEDAVDLDMLEERLRLDLQMIRPDEVVIFRQDRG
jgi:cell division protein FtsB